MGIFNNNSNINNININNDNNMITTGNNSNATTLALSSKSSIAATRTTTIQTTKYNNNNNNNNNNNMNLSMIAVTTISILSICGLTTYGIYFLSLHMKRKKQTKNSEVMFEKSLENLPEATVRAINMDTVKQLQLNKLGLTRIPQEVLSLTKIVELNLSNNALCKIPKSLCSVVSLRELNLSKNEIKNVPQEIGELRDLEVLNLMNNKIHHLPNEMGNLCKLYRLGVKSNVLEELPRGIGKMCNLIELYLTDNKLQYLPQSMGNLHKLRKLQCSFNELKALPSELQHCRSLELARFSSNKDLMHIPSEITLMSSLCWCSFSGSKFCPILQTWRDFPILQLGIDIIMKPSSPNHKLGDGASGEVFLGYMLNNNKKTKKKIDEQEEKEVAIKIFKADVSPDGDIKDEIAVSKYINHHKLTNVIGLLDISVNERNSYNNGDNNDSINSNSNNTINHIKTKNVNNNNNNNNNNNKIKKTKMKTRKEEKMFSLVMEKVKGNPLAEKPNFNSVLRCRWHPRVKFTAKQALRIIDDIASGLEYLHSQGICHGDIYAHNILTDIETGESILCDFGASFFYPLNSGYNFEFIEVRAFGLFMKDIINRVNLNKEEFMKDIIDRGVIIYNEEDIQKEYNKYISKIDECTILINACLSSSVNERPTFGSIRKKIRI